MSTELESAVLELLSRTDGSGWTDNEIEMLQSATHIPSVRSKLWSIAKPIEPTYRYEGSKGYFWWDENGERHFTPWMYQDPQPLRIYRPEESDE